MKQLKTERKAPWKLFFILLAGLNALILLLLTWLLFFYPSNPHFSTKKISENQSMKMEVQSSKAELEGIVNAYLKKAFEKKDLDYRVDLTDQLVLYGNLILFGKKIDLSMSFVPSVQKNGDLLLKQKSMTVGVVNLPVRTILEFLEKNDKIPDWVIIQPKKKSIYVAVTKIKNKPELLMKVKEFDLRKDRLRYEILVPYPDLKD